MAERKVIPDGAVIACLDCDWSSADLSARHECPNDPKLLQAKLEQAERALEGMRGERDSELEIAQGWERKYEDAESALAAAQGALRRVLEKVQSLIAEFGDRPSAALDIVNAYAEECIHALAAESGLRSTASDPRCTTCGLLRESQDAIFCSNAFHLAPQPWPTTPEEAADRAVACCRHVVTDRSHDWACAVCIAYWIRFLDAAPAKRSVFPPHNHEPGAPIMARCSGCEAVKALFESGKPEPRAAPPAPRHVHDGGLKCSCGAIGPFDAPKAPPEVAAAEPKP